MAAYGLGPAAQDGFEAVGQVCGFVRVRHQGHAGRQFRFALDYRAAKLLDLLQHAADGRRQRAGGLKGDRQRFLHAVDCRQAQMPARNAAAHIDRRRPILLGSRCRTGNFRPRSGRILERPARRLLESLQQVGQASHTAPPEGFGARAGSV